MHLHSLMIILVTSINFFHFLVTSGKQHLHSSGRFIDSLLVAVISVIEQRFLEDK